MKHVLLFESQIVAFGPRLVVFLWCTFWINFHAEPQNCNWYQYSQLAPILQNDKVLLDYFVIPVIAGWLGVVSTIRRSARPVLEGWGAAGWGWNKDRSGHCPYITNTNEVLSHMLLLPVWWQCQGCCLLCSWLQLPSLLSWTGLLSSVSLWSLLPGLCEHSWW